MTKNFIKFEVYTHNKYEAFPIFRILCGCNLLIYAPIEKTAE